MTQYIELPSAYIMSPGDPTRAYPPKGVKKGVQKGVIFGTPLGQNHKGVPTKMSKFGVPEDPKNDPFLTPFGGYGRVGSVCVIMYPNPYRIYWGMTNYAQDGQEGQKRGPKSDHFGLPQKNHPTPNPYF